MGVGRADNAWWLDVLEWGQASPYANFFDIGWNAPKPDLRGKVLLPFLSDHYGVTLEACKLVPYSTRVRILQHLVPGAPLSPCRCEGIWAAAGGVSKTLANLTAAFRKLTPATVPRRARSAMRARAAALKSELAQLAASDLELRVVVDRAIQSLRGVKGDPSSFVPLHQLLERQHYRLAYWRAAADEINYRRFLDINKLAGVRMEQVEVFETAHRLVCVLA